MWFGAIKNQDATAAWPLWQLAFVNFEDIFPSLIGGDESGSWVDGGDGGQIARALQTTGMTQRRWRPYFSGEGKWEFHDLEGAFQSYDTQSYVMHKFVHVWGHDRLESEEQRPLSSLALELMADVTSREAFEPSQ